MFCEKCGTKNTKGAKFCEKCGNKIEIIEEPKKKEQKTNSKLKGLPKKTKIIMGIVLVILVVAMITLCILLNNPVKKVEDSLTSYYNNYSENSNKELVEIGKVLKSNKDNEKVLNQIKETTHKTIEKWVKNFNTEYKNKEDLRKSYQKAEGALRDIYQYFNGLEYIIESDLYSEYREELSTLYNSKTNYFTGKEQEEKKNEYYAYYYYQKVVEKDNYYKESQKFINDFVKEEITDLKEKAESLIKINENSTDEDILNGYLEELEYLEQNKTSNNIDLSNTEEYKKLYEEATSKVLEYTKKIVEEKNKNEDYAGALKIIENTMSKLDRDSNGYKELEELKKNDEDKMPDTLVEKYRVSSSSGASYASWKKEIDGKEYDSYVRFSFNGNTEQITYRLNNEYKKLKTTIVRGEDWDKSFTGYFVIYGDGKELYKSDAITKSSELKESINIDVTGIDDLKIEFVTTSKPSGWDSFYIYLVEPYLYK